MSRDRSFVRRLALTLSCLIALFAVGCGGTGALGGLGSGSQPGAPDTTMPPAYGALALRLTWPAMAGTGLAACQSVKIEVARQAGQPLPAAATVTLNRPTATATLASLPSGNLVLTATGYAGANATGAVLASGRRLVTIAANQNASVALSLTTVAARVVVSPAAVTLPVGNATSLVAGLVDAAGATVLAPTAASCVWSVASGASVARVDTSGRVTALAVGSATIRATKADSGLFGTAQVTVAALPGGNAAFNLTQTMSDEAQRTTLAFAGLALLTGNLEAQSFFPPGKVADYTGFQYLRDNDPDRMGHNTSFLTRVAYNVIFTLNDSQFAQLKTLAVAQQDLIAQYGYKRYPLMKAFRRLADGALPTGATGLDVDAVRAASRELYRIDGQISYDRAVLYAQVLASLTSTQRAYLDAMKGRGFNSWPNITNAQVQAKMAGLPQGTAVAVMTYAGDLFSWYAGSVEADVYFCPERHGTYFGSFYMKDAPAVGHEGYSINEQLTATAGAALCDSSKGYVTAEQAALVSGLVDTQRANLFRIVDRRTSIATLLRGLIANPAAASSVRTQVLALSDAYGDLDGADNAAYATVFAQVGRSLSTTQRARLLELRRSIMAGTYADGTPFDFTVCTTPFLYSAVITDPSVLTPYLANTDYLF